MTSQNLRLRYVRLRQTVYTHCVSVHQAAKLVAALLRVAGVTAGLAESNGSLPPGLWHITCRLTAKNRDQLRNPTLCNRVWATFTFYFFMCGVKQRRIIVLFKWNLIRWFMKMSLWSLSCQQSVFQRYHSEKHLWEFYPQHGGKSQLALKLRHCHPMYQVT